MHLANSRRCLIEILNRKLSTKGNKVEKKIQNIFLNITKRKTYCWNSIIYCCNQRTKMQTIYWPPCAYNVIPTKSCKNEVSIDCHHVIALPRHNKAAYLKCFRAEWLFRLRRGRPYPASGPADYILINGLSNVERIFALSKFK